jgi:hypothetical protein
MTLPPSSDDDGLQAAAPPATRQGIVPASLQAEYQELFHKREQLRAVLDRARSELADLRKAKAG